MFRCVRSAALTLLCLLPLGSATQAAIVLFDIDPDVPAAPGGVIPGGTLPGASPYTYSLITIDFDGGGADLQLRTARADAPGGPGVDQVVVDGINDSQIITKGPNSYLNTPFVLGDVIGDGLDEYARAPNEFNVLYDGFTPSAVLPGDNYIGFLLTTGNYGYVRYNYDPTSATYTFLDGAYEDTGAAITVAAVPEPTSLAAVAVALVFCWRSRA